MTNSTTRAETSFFSSERKITKFFVFFLFPVAGYLLLYSISGGCPVHKLTGVECPGCGSLHALYALMRGDFSGYLHWNPFALPYVLAVFCLLLRGKAGRLRPVMNGFSYFVLCGGFFFWIVKILFFNHTL